MSIGGLIAIAVFLVAVVALVFKPAMPDWLPLVLIAGLAVAILLHPIKWNPTVA